MWIRIFKRTRGDEGREPSIGQPVATEISEIDKFALDFIKAEYETLRTESAQARQSQQSILQWSMAIIGVVFSAGIILVNQSMSTNVDQSAKGFLYVVFLFVFGFVLPLSSWCASLAWFGELIRMERSGRYLRGFEVSLTNIASRYNSSSDIPHLRSPLRWENYIADENDRGIAVSKQRVGYAGCLGLYLGGVTVPLAVALIRLWGDPLPSMSTTMKWVLTAYSTLVLSGFTASLVILVVALQRAGRQAADLSKIVPAKRQATLDEPLM